MGEDDSSRVVDDRAQAVGIKRASHIRRRSALRSVTGNQEPGVRHDISQLRQLLGVGCSHHGTNRSVATGTNGRCVERLDLSRDMLINGSRAVLDILEQPAAGIRSLHQYEDPGRALLGDFDKGGETVFAEIGADG